MVEQRRGLGLGPEVAGHVDELEPALARARRPRPLELEAMAERADLGHGRRRAHDRLLAVDPARHADVARGLVGDLAVQAVALARQRRRCAARTWPPVRRRSRAASRRRAGARRAARAPPPPRPTPAAPRGTRRRSSPALDRAAARASIPSHARRSSARHPPSVRDAVAEQTASRFARLVDHAAVRTIGSPAGDDDRVLLVGGVGAVGGDDGPAVRGAEDVARPGGDHRLDGHDQALVQPRTRALVGVVVDGGRLVQAAPDAVAGELAQDAEPARLGDALHRSPDVAQPRAGRRRGHAARQGGPRRGDQALVGAGDRLDGDRRRGVAEVAVELDRDVELDQVAGLDPARARDPVDRLVADADADRAREAVGDDRARAPALGER